MRARLGPAHAFLLVLHLHMRRLESSRWMWAVHVCRLGTRVDWAIALHAYGDPDASDWGARAPFQGVTLADAPRVIAYQAAKLAEARAAAGSTGSVRAAGGLAPQELLAASEQGWSNPPASARAPRPQTRMGKRGSPRSLCWPRAGRAGPTRLPAHVHTSN